MQVFQFVSNNVDFGTPDVNKDFVHSQSNEQTTIREH